MSKETCPSCSNDKKICNIDQKVSKSFSENWDNIDWNDYKPNVKMKQKGRKYIYVFNSPKPNPKEGEEK